MKRWSFAWRGVFAAMAVFLATPHAFAQGGAEDGDELVVTAPNLAMWRLHDADSEVLILAAVTALPRDVRWNRAPFQRALAGADDLIVEDRLSLGPVTIARLLTTRRTAFLNPDGARLSDFLSPALRARLQQSARAADIDPASMERLRPYIAGARLINEELRRAGLDPSVDLSRDARAMARRARVRVVEAPIAPLRAGPLIEAMSALPVGADTPCLEDQLALSETAPAILQQRAHAWMDGDAAQLRAFADVIDITRCVTALAAGGLSFESLARNRAEGWSRYLVGALDRPGRRVAVIDADLFLSRDGVLTRLTRAGMQIALVE